MHVLFIDDDPEDIELVTEILSDIDDRITYAALHDCQDVQSRFQQMDIPDIIFLDAHMSPAGGIQCLLELKSMIDPLRTRIIVFAGTMSEDEERKFTAIGVDGVINKGSSYSEIKDQLSQKINLPVRPAK